jgi:hypothetical protein
MNRRATTTGCGAGVYTTVGMGCGKSPGQTTIGSPGASTIARPTITIPITEDSKPARKIRVRG